MTVLVALLANALVALAKSIAALVTGSASLAAEAAHSWVDVGNQSLLVIAGVRARREADDQHPVGYGREAYVWSLLAAAGMFLVGSLFAASQGIGAIRDGHEPAHLVAAFLVLGVSALLEGASLVQSLMRARQAASAQGATVIDHILDTSDPTLRAVVAEDAAALVGLSVAAVALALGHGFHSGVPDGIGSIVIAVLLGSVAVVLIDRNRRFLVGEGVDPHLREAVLRWLLERPSIHSVSYLHLEYAGPSEVSLMARIDLESDPPESVVAATIRSLEEEAEAHDGVRVCVLSLSAPGTKPLPAGLRSLRIAQDGMPDPRGSG